MANSSRENLPAHKKYYNEKDNDGNSWIAGNWSGFNNIAIARVHPQLGFWAKG
jgi:hypothetical protein